MDDSMNIWLHTVGGELTLHKRYTAHITKTVIYRHAKDLSDDQMTHGSRERRLEKTRPRGKTIGRVVIQMARLLRWAHHS